MPNEIPDFKRSYESSANWMNLVVAGIGAVGGLPFVSKLLSPANDETIHGTIIGATGIFVVGWIIVTLIKTVAGRSSAVEVAYLHSNAAAVEASGPAPAAPAAPDNAPAPPAAPV